MSLIPAFLISDVFKRLDEWVDEKNKKIFETLHYIGVEFVNNARKKGEYRDRTGNLRASIGYLIAYNGKIEEQKFTEHETKIKTEKKAKEIAKDIKGWGLVGMAGMEYAAAVESKGFDVISNSVPIANELLQYFNKKL